jgi:hypothetical protein
MLERSSKVKEEITYPSGWQIRALFFRNLERAVPRIPDEIRNCVFYVYPDEISARNGERAGGSGFLVGVPSQSLPDRSYCYAVTNRHVIRNCGPQPILRFNTEQGELRLLRTPNEKWVIHANQDDLAAIPVTLKPPYSYEFLGEGWFLTKQLVEEHDIGPGDDVFFIGRFVNHEGRQQNRPALRFGNISMMPWEPVPQEGTGFLQESFIVEGRSVAGYSGSPVFVHIPPFAHRPKKPTVIEAKSYGPWLLGVDWGHLKIAEKIIDRGGKEHPDGLKVHANSGMSAVVPAWKLKELLYQPELAEGRERNEERLRKDAESRAALDSTAPTPPGGPE